MAFEAEPGRAVGGTATLGENTAWRGAFEVNAGTGAQVASSGDEGGGEALVEHVAADGEGGRGQGLAALQGVALKPGDLVMAEGVG